MSTEMSTESEMEDRLAEIARSLRSGDSPPQVTVRTFLRWFLGSQRRGSWIVFLIRRKLEEAGLVTVPDFESTFLDAEIKFELAMPPSQVTTEPIVSAPTETLKVSDELVVQVIRGASNDPTYRVSKLAAANRVPTSVAPTSTLAEVLTLMFANDFSQLPVMTSEREVKGMISWSSIGSRLALGRQVSVAQDAMESHAEISSDASLFTVIPLIVEHEYVLVRAPDKRIVGIVTTSDLSVQFRQLSEPFLLLGEIENHIRRIIDRHFEKSDLCAVTDNEVSEHLPSSAADMTIGEYQRLLEEPTRWSRLKLNIDRSVFNRLLDRVREIRNDVMHFDPDGIPEDDLESLRDFSRFLRTLQTIGAT